MKSPGCCLSGASQCCKASSIAFFLGRFSQETLRVKSPRKGPHRNHWPSDYGGSGQNLRHPEPWTKPSISTTGRKLHKGQKSTETRSVEKEWIASHGPSRWDTQNCVSWCFGLDHQLWKLFSLSGDIWWYLQTVYHYRGGCCYWQLVDPSKGYKSSL